MIKKAFVFFVMYFKEFHKILLKILSVRILFKKINNKKNMYIKYLIKGIWQEFCEGIKLNELKSSITNKDKFKNYFPT
jgi:hypothetical protein